MLQAPLPCGGVMLNGCHLPAAAPSVATAHGDESGRASGVPGLNGSILFGPTTSDSSPQSDDRPPRVGMPRFEAPSPRGALR